jgi:cytochrome b6-f complex iron-sulfur subunit
MEERVRSADLTSYPHPCAGCVSRRAFIGQSALVATAALLAACGDGDIGGGGVTGPPQGITVKVSSIAGLATVGTLVNINAQIAAKRLDATTFAAFSRSCTHLGTMIEIVSTGFFCPNHGSQFDANGHVTLGPAARDLDKVATSYDPVTDILTFG